MVRCDEERKISWVSVKIRWTGLNAKSRKQNTDSLPVKELNIARRRILAVNDSGADIYVLRKYLIRGWEEPAKEGHFYLLSAIGRKRKADIVNLPAALWGDKGKQSSEIHIIAAVAKI